MGLEATAACNAMNLFLEVEPEKTETPFSLGNYISPGVHYGSTRSAALARPRRCAASVDVRMGRTLRVPTLFLAGTHR
jgi:hypothetical protein